MWRKYLAYIQRSFSRSLTYRSEMVVWLVLDSIPVLILFLVWVSIFSSQTNAQGYTLPMMLQYYLIGMVINAVTASHFESWRVAEIRQGKIDYYLARPLPYLLEIFLRDLGGKACYLMFVIPFQALLIATIYSLTPLPIPSLSIVTGLSFLLLLVAAYLIEFLAATTIVLLGFWFEGAEGLEHFKWIIVTLFSGWMIPVAFMPRWMQTLVSWLPFQYMYAIPIGIVQQTAQVSGLSFLYLGGFVGLLLIFNLWLWEKAKYRYASAGG